MGIKENGDSTPCSKPRATTDQKSTYEETSLTIETAIRALQEVDFLAIHWQTVSSRSKSVLIGVFDAGTASVEGHFF